MKTKIAMAALALLAVSCSKNDNMGTPDAAVNAKAIRIGQSVQGVTRAVVTDGSDVTATVLMRDASETNWTSFTAEKKNDIQSGSLQKRANVSVATFKAGANQEVNLNPSLYYKHEASPSSDNALLVAVAPAGTLAATGTVVTMTDVDGQQDVMYSSEADAGSESSPTNPVNLAFNHLTTQLNFQMKLTAAASGGEWNGKAVSLKSISIQSAQLPQSVDAASGAVVWTAPASLVVPNIAGVGLSATEAKAGSPVMVMGGGKVVVDVVLTVGDKDISFSGVTIQDVDKDLITATAKSHLITLNVKEPVSAEDASSITATATVTKWQTGANGSADLN